MNFRTRKLHLNQSPLLTMEELKKILGSGNKVETTDITLCYICDDLCAITCAIYTQE